MTSERPRSATIKDVARVAQVSMTTVSHALSAKRPVNAETAERIQAAIDALGYVPHSAARTLQAGKTFMLGLVVPDVSDPFFGRLAVAVERAADENDYGVVLSSSNGAPARDARYFNLLRSRSIDGLIYVAGALRRDNQLAELARSFPIVLADEWVEGLDGIPLVASDNREGGRLAGEHLRDLGHRSVAVLAGPRGLRSAEERVAGFCAVFPHAEVLSGDFSEETAFSRTAERAARHPLPTAIFASNDLAAFGVVDALGAAGLAVPTDVSVVGFDDVALARRISPALTTVRQDVDEIGRQAVQTLLELVAGDAPSPVPPCPVELVVRASTAPPPPPSSTRKDRP
ncbi:LacI family DNA-binding transcriptional regulator [Herbiconiux ginsengi]|uniref:Transcriptional regulator, LacI family n=1 Tax=Herbiconiux ginsengi TaxID=381665 RepID=A0A1H3KGE3_9MICO|nr:LacI family DNA-binding transcriptional regulator [Herbiconiux ginsengi]SDY51099.1 transcriptional regulator, LacI family [Herbiconiux ginsengi]